MEFCWWAGPPYEQVERLEGSKDGACILKSSGATDRIIGQSFSLTFPHSNAMVGRGLRVCIGAIQLRLSWTLMHGLFVCVCVHARVPQRHDLRRPRRGFVR
jgi:hypothetical protein